MGRKCGKQLRRFTFEGEVTARILPRTVSPNIAWAVKELVSTWFSRGERHSAGAFSISTFFSRAGESKIRAACSAWSE